MMPPENTPGIAKPDDIVDRDDAWRILVDEWQRAAPALLFGIGRRRAGKSWVLSRFARVVDGVYYQATRRTAREQLAHLSRIIGERLGDAALRRGVPFPDWESLLAYLAERAQTEPLLLVLDEFPYLCDAEPALTSVVQQFWDHAIQGTRLKLVLNGSHIAAMRRLEAADQPLYGRRTGRLLFPPLQYEDVKQFVPGYTSRDRMLAFGAFGGLPGQLALLDPDISLGTNIARQMLSNSGRLADQAQHMLDGFLGDADIHYSIIQAIANGEHTWSRLASRLGVPGGSLSRPVRWLEEMQVIARIVPVTEKRPLQSKRALYQITDSYVAFWHRFVAPLLASGALSLGDPETLWRSQVEPRLADYMGRPFEEICRSWTRRTTRLPFRAARVGSWWDAASTNEVDVVALGPGDVLLGECKWGAVGDDDLARLRARTPLVLRELSVDESGGRVHHALFSASGTFSAGVSREIASGRVIGVTGADLESLAPVL